GPSSGSSSARRRASRNFSSSSRSRSFMAATSRWKTSSARALSSSSPLSRASKSLPPARGCLAWRWERTWPVSTSITRSELQSGQRTVSLRLSLTPRLYPLLLLYGTMSTTETLPSRDEAWQLLCQYTEKEGLRKHALAVEAAVRFYARQFGEDEELWGITALLHDF